ncbi:LuxR C-terminal-related transcriptional regulator [Ktedonospora formicarum]|uniref:LuxR family transcriptional regulator n=1 Tax=Ktedonospora formicarum TaxID=2778364 RepID=A0A8J3MXZ5_9CHLR|nr:LuxR C-terminal-related transcriptional regulator [Ktedonospora formicarum]GHO50501.1 LuxR family transcriptional regulator [Ktedonospora formicarum]
MPKPAAHVLTWSAEHQCYLLQTLDHPPQSILPGDEGTWQIWLMTHSSFSFQGQQGRLNVFKEDRPRGQGYWYAYHTSSGQTSKRYLGPGARVSLARLEEIAQSVKRDKRDKREQAVSSLHLVPPPVSRHTTQGGIAGPSSMVFSAAEFKDPDMMVMTRLSPPHLPATLVVRKRLLSALDAAISRPLTLLSASAGWGKTTLLTAWVQRQQDPVAWLSLEALDNDPIRFWTSLIAALRRCWPEIGKNALTLLQQESLSLGITALLNELTDRNAQTSRILLILDDYHVINMPAIHASLTFFLEHLPPRVHLLLASRVDPELPLPRLHLRGQVSEIRDSDLRFTLEETQRFLTQSMGLVLSKANIALLQTRIEGWIAGLQLAALVLQKQADPSAYVSTLSGSYRFLLDYMRDEILVELPQPLQDFLLQTSGLSRLNASLCDAVTRRNDSEFVLEQVMRANLFLQALPGEQPWYRYHALWAQALQHEARRRLGVGTMHVLSRQASQWYEQHHLLPEAIEAALAGEDYGRVARLVERFVTPQSFRNAYHTLSRWLRQLPEEILRTRPELCFQSSLALTFTTDRRSPATWEQVERLLQWAKQGFEATAQWEHLGEALQLHADLAYFQEDLPRMFALSQQVQPRLPEDSFMYPDVLLLRGLAARLSGEVNRAWQYFLEGYRREKNLNDHAGSLGASLCLGEVCLEKGELRRASHYYQQALAHMHEDQELAREQLRLSTGSTEPFFVSWAYHCLAQLAYERNELADAQHALSEAQALRETPAKGVHVLTSGMLIQARLLHVCRQTEKAQEVLSLWERQTRFPWPLRVIRTCRARLHLANGDLSAVERWAQEKQQADQSQAPEQELPLMLQQEEALLLVRLHIAQRRGETALKALVPWKEKAQAQGRKRSVLEIQILEALAHAACQEHRQVAFSLQEALRLAHPENYQRVFLDEGPTMEILLKTLLPELRETSLISYTRILLRAFAQKSGTQLAEETSHGKQDALQLEPLSEQEQRVLCLLVVGRSNPEIARELVISVNTVKTHVQSLYHKLNVHSRIEASEAARRLSLL